MVLRASWDDGDDAARRLVPCRGGDGGEVLVAAVVPVGSAEGTARRELQPPAPGRDRDHTAGTSAELPAVTHNTRITPSSSSKSVT